MQPVGFAGANVAGIFEFVDKQIYPFHSAVHNVDFVAYFTREQQIRGNTVPLFHSAMRNVDFMAYFTLHENIKLHSSVH